MIDNAATQQMLLEMSLETKGELREANARLLELTRQNERLLTELKSLRSENRRLTRRLMDLGGK